MIGEPTPTERKKRKATSPNPLSHRKAREVSSDSSYHLQPHSWPSILVVSGFTNNKKEEIGKIYPW
jgi:N-acetylmuramoyl-L-alanine amidase